MSEEIVAHLARLVSVLLEGDAAVSVLAQPGGARVIAIAGHRLGDKSVPAAKFILLERTLQRYAEKSGAERMKLDENFSAIIKNTYAAPAPAAHTVDGSIYPQVALIDDAILFR